MRRSLHSDHFVLEVFDSDLWCPIAQTVFHVADLDALRAILGLDADHDRELANGYHLDDGQLAQLVGRLGVNFDRTDFASRDHLIELFRWSPQNEPPYLIHTRYELPLLLDGRKKLARLMHFHPPMTFDGEHRFDHWVAEGSLHREVVVEPFGAPAGEHLGSRTVFYTPKGEEWRIPAHNLIWRAWTWNEDCERLEGMLFGYEDWQNDWWIAHQKLRRGAIGGLALCCPVTPAGLAWLEAAGFRALPPVASPALTIAAYDPDAEHELHPLLLENPDSVAVVRFNVLGREAKDFIDLKNPGPWQVQAERISELNRHLRGEIAVVARRNQRA